MNKTFVVFAGIVVMALAFCVPGVAHAQYFGQQSAVRGTVLTVQPVFQPCRPYDNVPQCQQDAGYAGHRDTVIGGAIGGVLGLLAGRHSETGAWAGPAVGTAIGTAVGADRDRAREVRAEEHGYYTIEVVIEEVGAYNNHQTVAITLPPSAQAVYPNEAVFVIGGQTVIPAPAAPAAVPSVPHAR
ncbi:MAG TPA: hypothetical protein VFQ88_12285 [Nevskiaceae bacterium]|nr:hypothetical protein [Nevskiaceae bacterium]